MPQHIEISDTERQQLKIEVYRCSKEFLHNAWNATMRQKKQEQITKREGKKRSHWFFAELVLQLISNTATCDEDGRTFWIDPKGIFKITLPDQPYPEASGNRTAAD